MLFWRNNFPTTVWMVLPLVMRKGKKHQKKQETERKEEKYVKNEKEDAKIFAM